MASGDPVVLIRELIPPAANAATPDVRAGGSTPGELVPVWDFDASAVEYLDFKCLLFGYGGGGLTFTVEWLASSAVSGAVVWGGAIRAIVDDADDLDTSHTYDFNDAAADTAPSASGETSKVTITFTHGVDMDNLANGESFIFRLRRNATDGGDTMTGDAKFFALSGKET